MSETRAKSLPSPQSRLVDDNGRIDQQWNDVLQSLLDEIRRLRAIVDSHEQRITDLEP